ncbi:MAG: hypothetical protein GX200_05110 [Firmicutes bacterium]|nr:hypothetical protein [Bacillota bacterium]
MFVLSPVSPRVQRLRERYRNTIPSLDAERTKIITEYYQKSMNEVPIIRRAKALYEILSKMTVRVEEDELIVGNVGKHFRGCLLWAEYNGLSWLKKELEDGTFDKRDTTTGVMKLRQEDRDYLMSVVDFWEENGIGAKLQAAMPEELEQLATADVLPHTTGLKYTVPHGHFNANYRKAVEKGFGAIRQEALEKLEKMKGYLPGKDAEKYFFYRAVVISCDAVILFSKRFAAECRRQAELTQDEKRRAELLKMADSLDWIMEHPARTFHEALQVVYLYHLAIHIEGNYLGLCLGRVDQHVGDYLEADLAAGRITLEEAQELVDCFCLKVGDIFMSGPAAMTHFLGSYSDNMRITIGGRKPDGSDATNKVTYMFLQSAARLKLHDPTFSLGLHKDSPPELWEAGIEVSKLVGGIPTLENTDLIIDILHKRGLALEDARNYCVVGCVEITGSGCEFANPSGPFSRTHLNIANVVLQAINDGKNPFNGKQGGLHTGYLYEMESFDEVKAAFAKQLEYFMNWHFTLNNIAEYIGNPLVPVPIASATMDGCMESGRDMMLGGAKYNSTGSACIGIATAIDSLVAIKYLVYDKKICTARELYDAIMANWEGYELLRERARNEVPYFGNGDPYADEIASWVSDLFTTRINNYIGPRGIHRAGIYSAGANVQQGYLTYATPNGRKAGEPVSDAASPTQGADKNGPTGVIASNIALHPYNYGNGLQFNMRFHPSSVEGEEGTAKLKQLVETFFELGGMQLQYNVVSADTLRKAQANPEEYRDLVVRVAGFSAYFVELYKDLQDDIIRRTENYV